MKIVIAGGTGFLGSPLAEVYAEDGHEVRVLSRGLPAGESRHDSGTGVPGVTRVGWRPDGHTGPWAAALEGADAVVNLAGEGIGDARWTAERKTRLHDSRVIPTRSLVSAIAAASYPPQVLVSGSGVGYYGTEGDDIKTEASPAGTDFLAQLCQDWEAEARRAQSPTTRVVTIRTGLVKDGTLVVQAAAIARPGVSDSARAEFLLGCLNGMSRRNCEGGAGSCSSIAAIKVTSVRPSKAFCPVSI